MPTGMKKIQSVVN